MLTIKLLECNQGYRSLEKSGIQRENMDFKEGEVRKINEKQHQSGSFVRKLQGFECFILHGFDFEFSYSRYFKIPIVCFGVSYPNL